jgi:alanyl-tRNA synthetase
VNPHELREAFLSFWEERGHKRIPGAPIVPPGDPTLLFNSAGMVQFKPYFTGQADPPAPRMASVQKCFRTTDIESVGDTSHLTFFEMLGNFSIGDYFKAEVIPWAQEFLTKTLGLPQDRLWPAVYEDDDEAFELWRGLGYRPDRIMRYGEEDNYWFSGDVGPCGPDSEIHYDFGEEFGCGPDCHPSHGHDRFVEIWNLVFMTYYCDGEKREPLPKKNIDTGSGFERVMSVLLHNSAGWDKKRLPSVYDTEVFQPMIRRIEQLSGKKYGADEATDRAIRIVAEHSRAVTFLIGDERTPVVPSNEERGYVCRRMLRRAVYFGRRHLGIEQPFMADLANTVIDAMKESYAELERQRKFIKEIIGPEEQRFDQTLVKGARALEDSMRYRHELSRMSMKYVEQLQDAISRTIVPPTTVEDIYANAASKERISKLAREWADALDDILTHPSVSGTPMFNELGNWNTWLDQEKLSPIGQDARVWGGESPLAAHLEKTLGIELDGSKLPFGLAFRSALGVDSPASFDAEEFERRYQEAHEQFKDNMSQRVDVFLAALTELSGPEAFKLHDTYGFPIDLTRDIVEQNGFTVDTAGFEAEMAQQRERARASAGGTEHVAADALYTRLVKEPTRFTGYEELVTESRVKTLMSNHRPVDPALEGTRLEIVLSSTPFYPEGGGQVGDTGEIVGPRGRVEVSDTQRVGGKVIVHRGVVVAGEIAEGDEVTARVDAVHRAHTKRNHTATHLLHAALREVIGPHVRQAGSLVAPDHLRFDFTHTEAVTAEQLAAVESLVNEKVRQDVPVHSRETSFDEAMKEGVLAFFGDKYGDRVRVVEVNTVVPRFSAELCGGTHCERTGEIGAIIITGESSIGSGMRRIEALTGAGAERRIREQERMIAEIARKVGGPRDSLMQKVESLLDANDAQRKKIEKLERSLATGGNAADLSSQVQDVDGVSVLAARVDAPSVDALRFIGDSVRKSLLNVAAVLGAVVDDKPMFIAIVPKALVERGLHAGNLLKRVATVAGGNAGGRPDMAQGGGKDVSKLDEALAIVPYAVREMLRPK